ncbi:ActS/PrrB/RegB family redox-sensitive histidine kinase [Curvivirga sp.]|uniref:ActS/PrrB/RegB family redox-sensitive histidine kinase n=1 Tax=Curvivirga sp. TaxID=2856848 RepID=UPI003B59EB4E
MRSPLEWFSNIESPTLRREGEIRTHSLILLRWFAVFGQLIAIGVVTFGLNFPIKLYPCLILIGILAISNLWMGISTSQTNRMSNYHTARLLAFDMIQLTALFYYTGGLENPFSLTILVPVTIAATLLSRGATVMLTVIALFCATFMAFYHEPLPWQGSLLDIHTGRVSVLYIVGLWVALALAIILMALYLWSLTEEARKTSEALQQTESALAREQKMSALGGLAASAAHELGTPLSTISLVAKELMNDLPDDSPYFEDVELLVSQSLRCRDILAKLSVQPEHIGGENFEELTLSHMVEHAMQDHVPPHIESKFVFDDNSIGAEPIVYPSPELLQGLGNFYSNAGQFAKNIIETHFSWDDTGYRLIIEDDGPGFPATVREKIGQPYISTRTGEDGHMGLGLFIAITLLERIHAHVRVQNRSPNGARVEILFPSNNKNEKGMTND